VQVTVTAKPKSTCKAILGFYGADTKNMDLPDLVRQVAASGTEQQLRLMDDASGMLTGGTMPEYLYRRTSVVAGLLERPAEDGRREAIETGTERLTRTLLDNVTLSLPDAGSRDAKAGEIPAIPPGPARPGCGCRKSMPPGDIHESRLRRGHAAGPGKWSGR
jgi:hypothetical protein